MTQWLGGGSPSLLNLGTQTGGLSSFASGPWGMMLNAGLQTFMGARQAQAQAMAQRLQFEEQEFQRQWNNQVRNRQIAKENANKWFQNQKIAEAANKNRAERDFYIRYNYENETGEFSRQTQSINDSLLSSLSGRNISGDSGTAKALLRMAIDQRNKSAVARSVTYENALRGSERQQEAALNQRDFNYNEHIPFMPGHDGTPSGGEAFSGALLSGIGSVWGAYAQGSMNQDMLGAINRGAGVL